MMKTYFASLWILAGILSASAQFEGEIEMKTTLTTADGTHRGGGVQKTSVSAAGVRSEMSMQMGGPVQGSIQVVTLMKASHPDVIYLLNDSNKTYTEVDLEQTRQAATQNLPGQYTVEKLGEESILGHPTQHIRLINSRQPDFAMELWVAKDLGNSSMLPKMFAKQAPEAAGLAQALQNAHADGIVLKFVMSPHGSSIVTEVTNIEKKSLPASTFELPAGYTKAEGGGIAGMGMPSGMSGPQADQIRQQVDAAKQKMQEAMKNMPPAQRAMMEKMMKQQMSGQGNQ